MWHGIPYQMQQKLWRGRGDRGGRQIERQDRHCVTIRQPFFVSCKGVPHWQPRSEYHLQPVTDILCLCKCTSGVGFLVHCKGVDCRGQIEEQLKCINEVTVFRRKIRKILRSPENNTRRFVSYLHVWPFSWHITV